MQAIAFTAGVLVSFTVIVSVLLTLRALGHQIGWGFQLQSPWFVALMAYLMFAVGLSLSGVFVFGANLMGIGQGLAAQSGYHGEFFSGVFATVVAFPMYGATAWLVWVLTLQAGTTGLATVLTGLILIAFAAWLHQKTRFSPRLWKRVGSVVALVVVGGALTLTQIPTANSPTATQVADGNATSVLEWEPYTAQRLEELKAAGEPIFVNFSAS